MEEPNAVPCSSQNPNNLLTDDRYEDDRYEPIMNNLKARVFSKISPSGNIAPQLKTHIERRLHEFFPSFDTPSHPPYSSMIQRAISELNNEEGSTKEEISAFIKREYEHLPWGHESFLSHHLGKLCGNMELACVNNERYILLVEEDCELKEVTGSSRKKEGRRGGQGRKKVRVTKRKKKQGQAEKQQIEVLEDTLQAMELKRQKDQMTTLERGVQVGFNKQDDVQAIVTHNLGVVEEEKQLNITSPCEQKELICDLLSEQHPHPQILSNQQMEAKLHSVESPSFLEWHKDSEQQLDLSSMERSPKPKAPVNKDPQHQDEQQPSSKPRGRGRPRKLKSDTDMIISNQQMEAKLHYVESPAFLEWHKDPEQQLDLSSMERSPKPKAPVNKDPQHQDEQQPSSKPRGRGRPRKLKSDNMILSNQQMEAKLHSVESSAFLEWHKDPEQQLDLSSMERSPKPKAPVNKDPQHQDEQQPSSKPRGRGRPRKLKSDTDMILSNQQMEAKLHSVESPAFLEWHKDPEQQLDLSSMERSPKPKAPLNKDPQHQDEQQPSSKPRGRGRPPKLKSDTDMIRNSLLPSSDQDYNEQQQSKRRGRPPKRKTDCY
ncbi:apoptotic chromatin condensation inducer in the nucleus isoform X4 [Manihot esculenta]|uniref:apoptotic chromatin condensation inducer in the nucleus isoform X3 n=1 Tax=Manihot esculenta TaxID=3983 RepID=UPI001CC391A8|nr:apoptotic chromatin condensation inducer in the nucleus isoform X3 [Manihot esculenta]XP_043808537.1 apoptotic chromatin condensation inducer in the nucleus isoform X4 [Manihot esculenta]